MKTTDLTITMMAPADLTPYEHNPRQTEDAIDRVAELLKAYGFQQPIVADRDRVIIVGHVRWLAAQRVGLEQVPVHIADLDDEHAAAYRIADNKTGDLATWDTHLLASELKAIQALDLPMGMLGFDHHELQALGAEMPNSGHTPFDDVPKDCDRMLMAGDAIALGEHRLHVAGPDAALEHIEGEGADLLLADFVAIKGKPGADADQVIATCDVAAYALAPGRSFYLWTQGVQVTTIPAPLFERGMHLGQGIIWPRSLGRTMNGPFRARYRSCIYGWKLGAPHRWFGPRNIPDVWTTTQQRPNGMPVSCREKPTEIAMRALTYSTEPGDTILDVNAYLGSSLIAAEAMGRRAILLEADPKRASVAVTRWERFTGRKAKAA